jgi:hypothetical protein
MQIAEKLILQKIVSRPRYHQVSFVVSGMRKGMLFKFVISGAAARNASELTDCY